MPEIQELIPGNRYLFHSNSSTLLPANLFRATLIKKDRNRLFLTDIQMEMESSHYQYVNWTVYTQFIKKVEALEDILQPIDTKLPQELLHLIDTYL